MSKAIAQKRRSQLYLGFLASGHQPEAAMKDLPTPPDLPQKRTPHTYDAAIGQRFHWYRRMLRISLEQIASQLGISEGELADCEAGRATFSAGALLLSAEEIDIPCHWIMDIHDRMLEITDLDLAAAKLLQAFLRIEGRQDRELCLRLVEFLAAGDRK